jgi:hypothetical protein
MRPTIKSLAVISALLLAAPQGWCCYLLDCTEPTALSTPVERLPVKKARSCCKTENTKSTPQQSGKKPAQTLKACCAPSDSIEPKGVQSAIPVIGWVPLFVFAPNIAGAASLVPLCRDGLPAPLSLHVLHCVWLC